MTHKYKFWIYGEYEFPTDILKICMFMTHNEYILDLWKQFPTDALTNVYVYDSQFLNFGLMVNNNLHLFCAVNVKFLLMLSP